MTGSCKESIADSDLVFKGIYISMGHWVKDCVLTSCYLHLFRIIPLFGSIFCQSKMYSIMKTNEPVGQVHTLFLQAKKICLPVHGTRMDG